MLISRKLLQTYFDKPLPKADIIAAKLTAHSFEIEGIEAKKGDTLIDVKVLPNRAHDCLSHRGVAKEVSAVLNIPLKKTPAVKLQKGSAKAHKIDVQIADKRAVRYAALVLDNISVGPSPKWLKDALETLGARSINNVVDATNYVLYMMGQPLHAFDYAKISGKKIVVRASKEGEQITTLDGKQIALDVGTLVIADKQSPLAVAGVKGGTIAEVNKDTKTIVLESANFDGATVRKAAQRYNLRTDAAKRFEQGMTPYYVDEALAMVAGIIIDIAGGKEVIPGIPVIKGAALPKQRTVSVSLAQIERIVGAHYDAAEVSRIWKRLGFSSKVKGKGEDSVWTIVVPHERLDITIKEDLAEEVCRLVGLEGLVGTLPLEPLIAPTQNLFWTLRDKAREVMLASGFSEVYTYSFNNLGEVELRNPMASDRKALRNNLSHGLRESLAENLKYKDVVRIFEFGSVFGKNDGKVSENRSFAAAIGFQKRKQAEVKNDFVQLKGVLDALARACGLKGFTYKECGGDVAAEIYVGKTLIGVLHVQGFEIDFDVLVQLVSKEEQYRYVAPSKYPKVVRDVALWVPMEIRVGAIDEIIRSVMGPLVIDLALFDVFEKPEEGKKSFAFRMTLQSNERTLSDDEANTVAEKVVAALRAADARFDVRS